MKIDYLKPKFLYTHKNVLLKFMVITFLVGLVFRFFFFHSTEISPDLESPFPQKTTVVEPPVYTNVTEEDEAEIANQVSPSSAGE